MEKDVYGKCKLAFHRDKLEALLKGEITAPIYVRIKPTNRCNHKCYYCSYAPGSDCVVSETINLRDEIPLGKMLEILDDFKVMGVKAMTYSGGGEPLIYPHIVLAMKKTLENSIDLSIITNGQELNKEKADLLSNSQWVRISSDASNAKTFAEIRRVPESWFYRLSKNIENFAKIKRKDCELGINFVVNEKNAATVFQSAKYFKELGVNHIKITPVYNLDFFGYHKPFKTSVEEQIQRAREELSGDGFTVYDTYEQDFQLSGNNERGYPRCHVMQIIPVIAADSKVYFCHDKTYTKNGCLGSVKDQSFRKLWFSEEAKKIFRDFDPRKGCQHHCTHDQRNLEIGNMIENMDNLDDFKPLSEVHKNFI